MSCFLRQSTAVDVAIGPFLDDVTGKDAESALTITQPDIRLKKNGGAWAQKSAAQTLSHEEAGWYEVSLSTTDTDTLGILIVAVHESGALPVWREFNVVPANVWDSFFSTDLLQVDVTQWLGSAPGTLTSGFVRASIQDVGVGAISNLSFAAGAINAAAIADGAIDAATFAAGAINAAAVAADAIGASELATDAVQEIADAILDRANGIETGVTLRQVLRGVAAALMGKASGLATTTAVFRDVNDTKDRITATVDADGNRSAVVTDLT